MNNITPMSIIRDIAGNVPVEYDEIVSMKGGAAYDHHRKVIKLSDPKSTNGQNLACAAHEAFHAKRHREGIHAYYVKTMGVGHAIMAREEQIVNNLAWAYLEALPLTEDQRLMARNLIECSKKSYGVKPTLGSVSVMVLATNGYKLAGLVQKMKGHERTCWDEFVEARDNMIAMLTQPGIPVDDDGELIINVEDTLTALYFFLLFHAKVSLPWMDEIFEVGI